MYSSRDQHGLKDVSFDCVAMLYLWADGLTDLGPSTKRAVRTDDYKVGHPLHATLLEFLRHIQILALDPGFFDGELLY